MKKTTSAVLGAVLLCASALTVTGCSSGGSEGTPDRVASAAESEAVAEEGSDDSTLEVGTAQWPPEFPSIDGCQTSMALHDGGTIVASCDLPGSFTDAKATVKKAFAGAVTEITSEVDDADYYTALGTVDDRTQMSVTVAPDDEGYNLVQFEQRTDAA